MGRKQTVLTFVTVCQNRLNGFSLTHALKHATIAKAGDTVKQIVQNAGNGGTQFKPAAFGASVKQFQNKKGHYSPES